MNDTAAVDADAARLAVSALTLGVRGPLHSLSGFGELLAMTELDLDQQRLLEQMAVGADALLMASTRLTLLIRLMAAEAPPPSDRFDLPELLGEIITAAGTDTPVSVRIDPRVPHGLLGDVEAIRHILVEIVRNAGTYGRPPVTVVVDSGTVDSGTVDSGTANGQGPQTALRFSVVDHGPGLPAERVAALRATSAALPTDARGLGLYLARRLAERLGGRLAASRRPGGATTVALHASLGTAVGRATPPHSEGGDADAGRAAGTPLRVLLVEDDSANRILAQRQLTRLGHQPDSVTGGQAAVAAVLEGGYDVVLMDCHLPDIDGTEAARRIRASEADGYPGRRTPIVAVTADAAAGHRDECLAAGMDGFLAKPLDLDRLRSALASFGPPVGSDLAGDGAADVDLAVLDRLAVLCDCDGDEVAALVRAYLDELPARRLAVQAALRLGATRQAVTAAQTLRAASATIGALGVARACARVLRAARDGDVDAGHQALPDLLGACERTTAALAAVG